MDPLRDWHRYVEEQSRPARGGFAPGEMVEALPRSTWRPWLAGGSSYLEGLNGLPAGAIPELSLGAVGADTQHLATREMEDPTLHDQLPPPPPPPALRFQPPAFDLEPERLPTEALASLLRRPLLASREPVLEALVGTEKNGYDRQTSLREAEREELLAEELTPERQQELANLLPHLTQARGAVAVQRLLGMASSFLGRH